MRSFKVSLASGILTFILFAGGIAMENAHGQSDSPFANCIQMKFAGDAVQLMTDEDCNDQQFAEAVAYYKANGYPVEDTYMDLVGSKLITLQSEEFHEATK
jgi:hypothetical protein